MSRADPTRSLSPRPSCGGPRRGQGLPILARAHRRAAVLIKITGWLCCITAPFTSEGLVHQLRGRAGRRAGGRWSVWPSRPSGDRGVATGAGHRGCVAKGVWPSGWPLWPRVLAIVVCGHCGLWPLVCGRCGRVVAIAWWPSHRGHGAMATVLWPRCWAAVWPRCGRSGCGRGGCGRGGCGRGGRW